MEIGAPDTDGQVIDMLQVGTCDWLRPEIEIESYPDPSRRFKASFGLVWEYTPVLDANQLRVFDKAYITIS